MESDEEYIVTPEELENWRKAGKIAREALEYGKTLIKPGATLLDVSEKVEEKIKALGGECAFPAQISLNHVAAHYCADPEDPTIFNDQLACLDVGVHIDGCIGDNALTVDLSRQNSELVKASEEALKNASKILQIGTKLGEIGKVIEETIQSYGFSPIRNLSGHGLGKYDIHDSPSIPNFDNSDKTELVDGQFIAIEPFATNGAGMIFESEQANIFALVDERPVRGQATREILRDIRKYEDLPFTTRWLAKKYPRFKVAFALKELLQLDIIKKFPPLLDKNRGLVSQAENSFYIADKVETLTKI